MAEQSFDLRLVAGDYPLVVVDYPLVAVDYPLAVADYPLVVGYLSVVAVADCRLLAEKCHSYGRKQRYHQ